MGKKGTVSDQFLASKFGEQAWATAPEDYKNGWRTALEKAPEKIGQDAVDFMQSQTSLTTKGAKALLRGFSSAESGVSELLGDKQAQDYWNQVTQEANREVYKPVPSDGSLSGNISHGIKSFGQGALQMLGDPYGDAAMIATSGLSGLVTKGLVGAETVGKAGIADKIAKGEQGLFGTKFPSTTIGSARAAAETARLTAGDAITGALNNKLGSSLANPVARSLLISGVEGSAGMVGYDAAQNIIQDANHNLTDSALIGLGFGLGGSALGALGSSVANRLFGEGKFAPSEAYNIKNESPNTKSAREAAIKDKEQLQVIQDAKIQEEAKQQEEAKIQQAKQQDIQARVQQNTDSYKATQEDNYVQAQNDLTDTLVSKYKESEQPKVEPLADSSVGEINTLDHAIEDVIPAEAKNQDILNMTNKISNMKEAGATEKDIKNAFTDLQGNEHPLLKDALAQHKELSAYESALQKDITQKEVLIPKGETPRSVHEDLKNHPEYNNAIEQAIIGKPLSTQPSMFDKINEIKTANNGAVVDSEDSYNKAIVDAQSKSTKESIPSNLTKTNAKKLIDNKPTKEALAQLKQDLQIRTNSNANSAELLRQDLMNKADADKAFATTIEEKKTAMMDKAKLNGIDVTTVEGQAKLHAIEFEKISGSATKAKDLADSISVDVLKC